MASFMIHPDAVPTDREPATVELSAVQVVDAGSNYVRISGTATNPNPFVVKTVIVSGVLLDAGGQIELGMLECDRTGLDIVDRTVDWDAHVHRHG